MHEKGVRLQGGLWAARRPLSSAAVLAGLMTTLLFSTGCATTTPKGEAVRVTQNPQATTGCTFLKKVDVANVWGPGDSEKALKEKTAEAGGNVLFLGPEHFQVGQMYGEAYRCEGVKP